MTAIDWNKPVQTKGGRKVRILCKDGPDSDFPVVGFAGADEIVSYWTKSGKTCEEFSSLNDLSNVPKKHELFVNVWENQKGCIWYSIHPTKYGADKYAAGFSRIKRIACLHREFEEGEGL